MNLRTRSHLALITIAALLVSRAGAQPAPADPAPVTPQNTIVTADRLEMRNTGVESHLVFNGNVHLTGTNLSLTCDRVEVYAEQLPDIRDPGKKATIGKIGALTRILAVGNVRVSQEGRTATAGRAEVMPIEDKIVLTENPVVTDTETQVTVSGSRMTFFRGDRYGQIENPQVVGPAIPNLGFPRDTRPADAAAPAPATESQPSVAAPAATPPPATKTAAPKTGGMPKAKP